MGTKITGNHRVGQMLTPSIPLLSELSRLAQYLVVTLSRAAPMALVMNTLDLVPQAPRIHNKPFHCSTLCDHASKWNGVTPFDFLFFNPSQYVPLTLGNYNYYFDVSLLYYHAKTCDTLRNSDSTSKNWCITQSTLCVSSKTIMFIFGLACVFKFFFVTEVMWT